ncbi:Alpha/Beta hydrolase protein [Aspergillus recurvatus]
MPSLAKSAALSALADLKLPNDIRISPDGLKVVYALETFSRKDRKTVSSLWIADVGVDHSARQITSGLFRDEKPRWSPDGRYIAFLSDRGNGSSVIYLLGIGGFGEAYPLADDKHARGVRDFEWSADGGFIAFVSKDGDDDERDIDADEPLVFGGDKESSNQQLRVVNVERRTVRTLTSANQNVALFSWSPSPNLREIAYTVSNPTPSQFSNTEIDFVSVETGLRRAFITAKSPITSLVWTQPDKLHFIARPTPPYTQPAVYEARIKSKQYGSYFGWTGEAISLHRARDSVIARVQNPTHESAHVLGVDSTSWPFPSFLDSEYELTSFEAFRHPDTDDFTLVLARSSPQIANEVWSVTVKEGKGRGLVKLSSHNSAFDGFRLKRVSTTGPDGWECDGWLFTPKPVTITRRLPPTVVLVRSYPALPSFSMGSHLDVAYLTTAGYAVLCPNIRPGVRGGISERYADLLAILKKAVSQDLVDESRVTISGWADGGFLSSLAIIRNEFSFRAVVCGGGVLDWDFVNANGDRSGPGPDAAEDKDDGYVSGEEHLKGGAEKKNTPLLILHGREDDQVPVSGPLAFWRQRQRWNGPVQMVLYPNEEHVIRDRKHLIDLWTRVLGFYERHLA